MLASSPQRAAEPCLQHTGVATYELVDTQWAVKPPSTGKPTPITKLAPGLHSQSTAAATSSALPRRPIDCCFMISVMASAWPDNMSAAIGVSIVPGQTALMRMPRGAYSTPALLVKPSTACLVP